MRIVVFSDSHNEFFAIKRILDLNQGRRIFFSIWATATGSLKTSGTSTPGVRFLGWQATATGFAGKKASGSSPREAYGF